MLVKSKLTILLVCMFFGSINVAMSQTKTNVSTLTEAQKIEKLIVAVEQLQNAKFWRNGTSYNAAAAASHLRMKYNKAGSRIKTATDFIEKIGTASSTTGEKYMIEYHDGKKVECGVFLKQQLVELNAKTK